MSFDLEKARQMAAQGIPSLDPYSHPATALYLALDRIAELEEALIEERAKQLNVDEPCPGRTSYEHCKILDDICDGYPDMWAVCPRKKEKLSAAKDELHSEGKI